MTAPQEFPTTLGVYDLPTWAEDGDVDEGGLSGEGWSNGQQLDASVLNYPNREAGRWLRALATRSLDGSTNLMGTWAVEIGSWEVVAGLDAVLDPSPTTLWLDPNDTGAVKIQVRVTAGNPHTFTASKDTYVAVSVANMLALHDDPASMEFDEVANDDPAPTASAGFVYVWKVVTDGTTVTSSTVQIPQVPTFRTLAAAGLTTDTATIGSLTVTEVIGGSISATTVTTSGNVEIGGSLDMTSGAISNVTTLTASSSTGTITGASSSTTAGGIVGTNSSSGPAVTGTGTTGPGGAFYGGGSAAGATGLGGASAGAGLSGTAQAASSAGVLGTGANAATSPGVSGVAVNTSSYGVQGSSASSATTSGAGGRFDGLGSAPAVWAVAVDGHALIATSDTTSPTRAAIRVTGQDSNPSSPGAGDFFYQTTLDRFRYRDSTQFKSFHASPNGFLFGVSTPATSSNATTSGDIGDITITPEAVGDVLITVTGFWKGSTDTTTLTVLLKDITATVTILTTQVMVAPDRDADGQDRTVPFTVRYPYTLPSAASRLFRYRLNVSATTNWYDVVMTVQGVY